MCHEESLNTLDHQSFIVAEEDVNATARKNAGSFSWEISSKLSERNENFNI
jgi:hypothetical protein